MQTVILYTIGCPKCKVLETLLKQKNINFEMCTDIEKMKQKKIAQAPVLEVNDVLYTFTDAVKWVKEYAN